MDKGRSASSHDLPEMLPLLLFLKLLPEALAPGRSRPSVRSAPVTTTAATPAAPATTTALAAAVRAVASLQLLRRGNMRRQMHAESVRATHGWAVHAVCPGAAL